MIRARIRRVRDPEYRRHLLRLHAAPRGSITARRRELVEYVRQQLDKEAK